MDDRKKMLARLRDLDEALVAIAPGSNALREMVEQERDGIISALEHQEAQLRM